jgi:16S rRNA (cytosine967-C5)-methyltransferase
VNLNANKYNPRFVALLILQEVLHQGKKPKDSIERRSGILELRDRALLQEMVYGTLRNLYYLDWYLHPYLKDPQRLKKTTLNNLRVGAYQIIFMRIPDWASVNETVEIEKMSGRNVSLVNAVLRSIVQNKTCPALPEEPIKRLSIVTSHPEWLVKRWIDQFGFHETQTLLRVHNEIPPLTLRVNSLKTDRDNIARRLKAKSIDCNYTDCSPVGLKIVSPYTFGDLKALLGDVYIQDEAAQLISFILQPEEGQLILDACAAPGGKTIHIAELTKDRAKIYAVDKSSGRLEKLKENVKRHDLRSVRIIRADLTRDSMEEKFHRILLDAPCSSLGVCRRNPDVKYKYQVNNNLKEFQERQLELLMRLSTSLLPDGILLYSVCSFEPEEGIEVVNRFLHKRKDYFIIKTYSLEQSLLMKNLARFINSKGYFTTLPHRDGMDGFFAVMLSRR